MHWKRIDVKATTEGEFEAELRMEYKHKEATFAVNGGNQDHIVKYIPASESWELLDGEENSVMKLKKNGKVFEATCEDGPNLRMEARNISFFVLYGHLNDSDDGAPPSVIATFKMLPGVHGCKDAVYDVRIHKDLDQRMAMFYFAVFEIMCYHNLRLNSGNPKAAILAKTQGATAGVISATIAL